MVYRSQAHPPIPLRLSSSLVATVAVVVSIYPIPPTLSATVTASLLPNALQLFPKRSCWKLDRVRESILDSRRRKEWSWMQHLRLRHYKDKEVPHSAVKHHEQLYLRLPCHLQALPYHHPPRSVAFPCLLCRHPSHHQTASPPHLMPNYLASFRNQ